MIEVENTTIKYTIDERGNISTGASKPVKEQKKCHDKDCESKKLILTKLLNPMTSTQLWNQIKDSYDGKYKTFTSLLVRYQKYGYIEKFGRKPYIYRLTAWGVDNQKNPYMARDEQKRRYKEFQMGIVGQFINENPSYLKQFADDCGYIGGSDVRVIENTEFVDNHANDDKINELESKVKELEEDKEVLEYQLKLAEHKPKMIVNKSSIEQPQVIEAKSKDERSFDSILWAYKDKKMIFSAYKKLPKQIMEVVSISQCGNITENVKSYITRKGVGGWIAVPTSSVNGYKNNGFAKPLRPEQIEKLVMKWYEGTVYLCGEGGNIPITDVPRGKYRAPTQSKVVIKSRQD